MRAVKFAPIGCGRREPDGTNGLDAADAQYAAAAGWVRAGRRINPDPILTFAPLICRYDCEQFVGDTNDSQHQTADLRRRRTMITQRSVCVAVLAGVSLLIAAAASADDGALVDIRVAYPQQVAASPGDVIDVEVSVVGVEGWQSCALSYPASAAEQCGALQEDFGCDAAVWNEETEACDLSLCWCVSAVHNEIRLTAPFSLHEEMGAIKCEVNVPTWEGSFTAGLVIGAEILTADLPGDPLLTGVPMAHDARDNTSAKLFTCKVDVADNAAPGVYALGCESASSSDPSGAANVTGCVDGSIEIVAPPTPTSTPVPTATRRPSNDDGGCAVAAPARAGDSWLLMVPAAALLWLRRRPR